MIALAIFASILFHFSLVTHGLGRSVLSAPSAFTAAGILLIAAVREFLRAGIAAQVVLHLAETGLVLLLSTDASRSGRQILRSVGGLPARLLGMVLLRAIALGALAARLVIPNLSLWEAGT